jgi:threonyl-tRNA synthetase
LNIAESQAEYAGNLAQSLQKQGLRVESDLRNEKISYKIREHTLQKVPYLLVVGDKERDAQSVAVRARGCRPRRDAGRRIPRTSAAGSAGVQVSHSQRGLFFHF